MSVINRKAGTIAGDPDLSSSSGLNRLFKDAGIKADVHLVTPSQFSTELRRVAASDADIIIVGGGDGSINMAANIILGTRKVLGILPFGTMNNFSKTLGMPDDLREAVHALTRSVPQSLDLGEVNGKVFVNNSSIGIYPEVVRRREQYVERLGLRKYVAMFAAFIMLLIDLRFYDLHIEANGEGDRITTPFVFFGNNRYEPRFLSYPARESLTDGVLSAFYFPGAGRFRLFKIALSAFLGKMRSSPEVKFLEAKELTVTTRHKRLRVSRDGEIGWMKPPLHYRILPRAIDVLLPSEEP